jgi:hypothetical protein
VAAISQASVLDLTQLFAAAVAHGAEALDCPYDWIGQLDGSNLAPESSSLICFHRQSKALTVLAFFDLRCRHCGRSPLSIGTCFCIYSPKLALDCSLCNYAWPPFFHLFGLT